MVRTRIAPSPTGFPHIGTVYQAMLDRAFATKNNGTFFIRIEDTDQKRFVEGAENKIYESIDWFKLTEDESPRNPGKYGPYKQSERLELYKKYALELVEKNHAYYCFCTAERLDEVRKKNQLEKKPSIYDKKCRNIPLAESKERIAKGEPYVIRMKIPENTTIIVHDLIRGDVSFDSSLTDDQVILKTDGFPTYHLAVVVDDHLMETTHILRGPEWLPSYPKHKLLYDYFGWDMPVVTHTPLITNMDGSKMAKRNGHASVSWYQEQGYLPEAVLNFIALLGWSHPEQKEIFDFEEFVRLFDFKDLDPINPKFDLTKLEWMNGEYIRKYKVKSLKSKVLEYMERYKDKKLDPAIVEKTIPLVQTRMKKLSDYWPLVRFIFEQPDKIEFPLETLKLVKLDLLDSLYSLDQWAHTKIYKTAEDVANKHNVKPVKLYMDLRFALSNQKVTAPLFEGMEIIGKERVSDRLRNIGAQN
ncbi:MAG: glutamate--tRNA ligase [Patescibacteria group bacterium]|jgi:glutamyl-tRNA synthetase